MQKYYSGQGIFSVAPRDAEGNPLGFIDVGNVSAATVDIEVEKDEHKESRTGQRSIDVTVITSKKGRLSMTVENFESSILALGLHGTSSIIPAGSLGGVGSEEYVVMVLDKAVPLPNPKLATPHNLVLKSQDGTTTYVLDTDYTIDTAWGTLKALSTGAITDLTKAQVAYDTAEVTKLDVFDSAAPTRWVRFHGVNTVDALAKKVVNIFKVEFDPISGYGLISDEIQGLDLQGDILYDSTRLTGSPYMNEFDLA